MNSTISLSESQGSDVKVPVRGMTRGGIIFCPQDDIWKYRDNLTDISLNFKRFPVTYELLLSIKNVLLWYAENLSPAHLRNMYDYLLMFLRDCSDSKIISVITSEDILNYRASLPKNREYLLGNIKGLLIKWHKLELPGIADEAISVLMGMKIKGNIKGESVSTMDPNKGPLSKIEWESIYIALKHAYEDGQIGLDDYLLAWLFIALGQRPIQYAALKVSDLVLSQNDVGDRIYILRIPRAKQRHQKIRDVFKERRLICSIGDKFMEHITNTKNKYQDYFTNVRDIPMFPVEISSSSHTFLRIPNDMTGMQHPVFSDSTQQTNPQFPLLVKNKGNDELTYHYTSQMLANRLVKIMQQLEVFSERTGKKLHITPRRFRYTYGTRLAAEGHNEFVIAELLDHTDTQNVGIYIETVPEIIKRIDEALAVQLAPLVHAFSGKIINKKNLNSKKKKYPYSIIDPRFGIDKDFGRCGASGLCKSFAPLGCYTCNLFRPWLDGPHIDFLKLLITERARRSGQGDMEIASILDRTIYAVAEVVRLCEIKMSTKEQANV